MALAIIIGLAYVSCETKVSSPVISASADGKFKIVISGKQPTPVDPWMTTISAQLDEARTEATTEIYAGKLSDETVSFDWKDESTCLVTFKQRDDTKRTIQITRVGESVRISDVSEI